MTTINSNISAYYAQNNLRAAGAMSQASIARLSSGQKIIKASDDVAALSIGTILRTNVNTLKTALTNANQGSTLLQIADGSLARVGEILQRQKALAVQANSGTLSANERGYLDQEFQALKNELDRIVTRTNFNGVTLLDGNLAADNTTIASEAPAALTTQLTDSTGSIDTTILKNGAGTFAMSSAGTAGNDTIHSLIGDLSDVSVIGDLGTDGSDDLVHLIININGVSYKSTNIDTDAGADADNVVFTAMDGSTVAFTLDLEDMAGVFTAGTVTQTEADTYAANVQAELAKLSIYQDRVLENTAATDPSAITTGKFADSVLAGMSGADIQLVGKEFGTEDGFAPSISNFAVKSLSSTSAEFSVTINGTVYSTKNTAGLTGGVTVDGTIEGNDLDGTGAAQTGVVRLTSADDANSFIDIDLNTNTAGTLSLVNQDQADAIANALNNAFGSGASGGLAFQVGTDSEDTVSISIDAVTTESLYVDDNGASVTMDLVDGDLGDIQGALDNAINSVTSRRADVGAMQSRFGYAASALEVSIQNLDAARGQFLDADISEESTKFATAQVLQQAAISVLAQANQIPQNLLKLIG